MGGDTYFTLPGYISCQILAKSLTWGSGYSSTASVHIWGLTGTKVFVHINAIARGRPINLFINYYLVCGPAPVHPVHEESAQERLAGLWRLYSYIDSCECILLSISGTYGNILLSI